MSQDIVADALNMLRNAKKAKKEIVKIHIISNLLIEVLKIMKQKGAIKRYKINTAEKTMEITLGDLSECRAVKPRFTAGKDAVEKYRRRYLPSRHLGTVIISTNKGLMTHDEAQEEKIGGSIIAYFY